MPWGISTLLAVWPPRLDRRSKSTCYEYNLIWFCVCEDLPHVFYTYKYVVIFVYDMALRWFPRPILLPLWECVPMCRTESCWLVRLQSGFLTSKRWAWHVCRLDVNMWPSLTCSVATLKTGFSCLQLRDTVHTGPENFAAWSTVGVHDASVRSASCTHFMSFCSVRSPVQSVFWAGPGVNSAPSRCAWLLHWRHRYSGMDSSFVHSSQEWQQEF